MKNKTTVEVSAGTSGVAVKIHAATESVASGLTQQVMSRPASPVRPDEAPSSVRPDEATILKVAGDAATQLIPEALQRPGTLLKVLWVDDRPQNNIGLQYAFQTLGMVVICIDSNDGIAAAFKTANGFDVVITDMGRGNDRQAGKKTIEIIRNQYSGTPVIVYTARYPADQDLVPPVIAITNSPQKVFTEVTGIATRRATSKR